MSKSKKLLPIYLDDLYIVLRAMSQYITYLESKEGDDEVIEYMLDQAREIRCRLLVL